MHATVLLKERSMRTTSDSGLTLSSNGFSRYIVGEVVGKSTSCTDKQKTYLDQVNEGELLLMLKGMANNVVYEGPEGKFFIVKLDLGEDMVLGVIDEMTDINGNKYIPFIS